MVDLDDHQVAPIKNEVAKIQNNFSNSIPHNNSLAGHLNKEYLLTECASHLENILIPLVTEYDKKFNLLSMYNVMTKDLTLCLHKPWVNFQKKYEFNPIHSHSGIMSFALWLKVPYNIEDERKVFPNVPEVDQRTACFNFHHISSLGDISTKIIPVDKTYENKLVMFPSRLSHSVNPFYTSDEYRISVSGNIRFKV